MTKLILTCTVQFCLINYKLYACHTPSCHYIQALFPSDYAPCTNVS